MQHIFNPSKLCAREYYYINQITLPSQKTDMASIQQVFMNAIYYELSAISEYDALVDYVSQHYQDDNMVEPMWKYIKKYKKYFLNRQAYEKLRSVVNEFRTIRIEPSEGFKRLIDNECSVRHSSYSIQHEDGWIINDDEEVEAFQYKPFIGE